jgi:hypothetical protein
MPGKRVTFHPEDWIALDQLARERHLSFQELAQEAFRDVLRSWTGLRPVKGAFGKDIRLSSQPVSAEADLPPRQKGREWPTMTTMRVIEAYTTDERVRFRVCSTFPNRSCKRMGTGPFP